jgi:ADP-ribosylglycohydrolase
MRTISYRDYYEKTLGGWLGKSIAGNMTSPLECLKYTHSFTEPEEFSPKEMLPNDDLDVQLIWLDVLIEKGPGLTGNDLMEAFIRCYPYNYSEYGYGKRNYRRGIAPPYSGEYANDYFKTGMGCPIRSEIWGMVAPGNPELAARCAEIDGSLDHVGDSVWAEQFLAAMQAEAFFESDMQRLIDTGMAFVPDDSELAKVILGSVDAYNAGKPWDEAIQEHYLGYCNPDASNVLYNMGVIILSLLYGEGHFNNTATLAVDGGFDTDSTGASVGSVLGIIYGKSIIEKKWLDMAGDKIVTAAINLTNDFSTFAKFTEATCAAGANLAEIGLNDIEIEDAPDLPFVLPVHDTPAIEVEIGYPQAPEIRLNEKTPVTVTVMNNSDVSIVTDISLETPDWLECDSAITEIEIAAGETIEFALDVWLSEAADFLPDTNTLRAVVMSGDEVLAEKEFGLAGAQVWHVLGPFVDTYDFKTRKALGVPEGYHDMAGRKLLRIRSLAECHNDFIDLDKGYIDEKSGYEDIDLLFRDATAVSTKSDWLKISDIYGLQGPCCVYALHRFIAAKDEEVEMHIGGTDPMEILFNGDLILRQAENQYFCPYNDLIKVNIKEGINSLILKLARTGRDNEFAMVMREAPFAHIGPIKTDLSFVVSPGK